MVEYFIESSTMSNIANKIREYAKTDVKYTSADVPAGIDAVYNSGFSDGAASVIDSPLPIEVKTEAEMNNILNAATNNDVGAIYKYIGETTSLYIKDGLYMVTKETK